MEVASGSGRITRRLSDDVVPRSRDGNEDTNGGVGEDVDGNGWRRNGGTEAGMEREKRVEGREREAGNLPSEKIVLLSRGGDIR